MDHSHQIIDAIDSNSITYRVWDSKYGGHALTDEIVKDLARSRSGIAMSKKFDVSRLRLSVDSGELLATAEEALRLDMLPLPFDVCFFDFGSMQKLDAKTLAPDGFMILGMLAVNGPHDILIQMFVRRSDDRIWETYPLLAQINKGAIRKDVFELRRRGFFPDDAVVPPHAARAFIINAKLFAQTLTCMETRHARQTIEIPSERLNKARSSRGSQPLFEHKIVTIDLTTVDKSNGTGTHASPRLHWRRGHIRTLASGVRTKVKPCLVGDPGSGFVSHDYRVKPTSPPRP
jgi:hypothetical protein